PVPVGLFAAALGTAIFLVYARRLEVQTSGGDRIEIVVAIRGIERGAALTEEMLTTRAIPQAYVDDRAIRATERDKVLGLKTVENVGVSQPVFWTDVVTTRDDQRDLSALVQPGYRAVTAPFASNPTFSLIHPGDFVDVLAVSQRNNSELRDSAVLLQRILVLAIGNETGGASGKNKPGQSTQAPSLTLSLNLQEAQLLQLASQRGPLSVALRNPNDQRVAENPQPLDSRALDDPNEGDRVRAYRRHEALPHGPTKIE
ncbi:MAG TPA: Flp pilus assembly protein CpaB, partial [Polyangiaceae bacterium]